MFAVVDLVDLIEATQPGPPHTAADAVIVTRAIGWDGSVASLRHFDRLPWRVGSGSLPHRRAERIGRFLRIGSEISELEGV